VADQLPGKPLGIKAYGSIGHLPNSRLGPSDSSVPEGQAAICCARVRDKHDVVIVQEKLDGSCVAVARIGDQLHALGRAGWPAQSSPHRQHQLFAYWVRLNAHRFLSTLEDGERIVGEWLAQAHGTRYDIAAAGGEPFGAFDIMQGQARLPYRDFEARVGGVFATPHLLSYGPPVSVADAVRMHQANRWPSPDGIEGVVYRVERKGKVEFLAKYVLPDKVDGRYFPEISGQPEVWNWQP